MLLRCVTTGKTHIAIVGAGIGGVALANALDRCGFQVSLLEQAETLSEIGAGLSIWENGLHALEVLGLRGLVEAVGVAWPEYEIHRSGKPNVLRSTKVLSLDGTVPPLIIKRGKLFGVLLESLSANVNVLSGFKVQGITGRTLISEDRRRLSADIIIGADGAHSRVRKELTQETPRFCNQICYRGISSLAHHSAVVDADVFDQHHHRFSYFRLPDNQTYWFDIVDSNVPYEDFENHREYIEGLSPHIARLVKATPAKSILCHPIDEMPPVTVRSDYIALIGDAAHPMQPSLGQGACLALEDAIVLAACLRDHADDLPKGLKAYLSKRKRRWGLYYKMCQQLGTGALDKGLRGRNMAIARMVHTPQWSMSLFGRPIFAFKQRDISF